MLKVQIRLKRGTFELQLGFHLAECGIAVILAASGPGKTSLINCIAGLETPDTGHIACHGETCFDSARSINLPPEKRRLGYVFRMHPVSAPLCARQPVLWPTLSHSASAFERAQH